MKHVTGFFCLLENLLQPNAPKLFTTDVISCLRGINCQSSFDTTRNMSLLSNLYSNNNNNNNNGYLSKCG